MLFTLIIFSLQLFLTLGDVRLGPESNSDVSVELSVGQIRGRKLKTANGKIAYIFLGLPYAEPPTGNLR